MNNDTQSGGNLPPRPPMQNQSPYAHQPPPGGYSYNGQPMSASPNNKPGLSGLAIAGLVLGVLGILGSWIPFVNFVSILFALVGLTLSIVGLNQCKKQNKSGRGMAIAGLILSALTIVISILVSIWGFQQVQEISEDLETWAEEIEAEMEAEEERRQEEDLSTTPEVELFEATFAEEPDYKAYLEVACSIVGPSPITQTPSQEQERLSASINQLEGLSLESSPKLKKFNDMSIITLKAVQDAAEEPSDSVGADDGLTQTIEEAKPLLLEAGYSENEIEIFSEQIGSLNIMTAQEGTCSSEPPVSDPAADS